MMELIYPYELAPILPAPTAESSVSFKPGTEFFPVIEPNGLVVARSPREYCHSGAKPLHPVVHLHIIDRYSRIYLQKRPLTKLIQPGKWDTAVGGHVAYGEMLLEALFRESYEELRFTEYNPIHLVTYEFESQVEKERISVYAAVGSFELNPDPEELDGGRWWDIAMIRQSLLSLL